MNSFTCEPYPCAVPMPCNVAADVCGSGMDDIDASASCTMGCATGHAPSAATAAGSLRALASFACDHNPCAVPAGSCAAAVACGSGAVENAASASCTVACATGHTPSTAMTACALGAFASFTCDSNPHTVATVRNAAGDACGRGVVEIADAEVPLDGDVDRMQLVSMLARLCDVAWEAVVFDELGKFEHIAISFSKINPTDTSLVVTDTDHLKQLQAKLLDVPGVWSVERVDEG